MHWLSFHEGQRLKALRTPTHKALLSRLIGAREKAGFTQQGLADRLERHQSFVAKYEGGERRLEVVEFVQICNALGVKPGRILNSLP